MFKWLHELLNMSNIFETKMSAYQARMSNLAFPKFPNIFTSNNQSMSLDIWYRSSSYRRTYLYFLAKYTFKAWPFLTPLLSDPSTWPQYPSSFFFQHSTPLSSLVWSLFLGEVWYRCNDCRRHLPTPLAYSLPLSTEVRRSGRKRGRKRHGGGARYAVSGVAFA